MTNKEPASSNAVDLSECAEVKWEMMVRLIQALSATDDLRELMQSVTGLIRDWSKCEAIGIRLREGDDFPYFETSGFPAAFVEKENHLCAFDSNGRKLCDSAGNPVLECMCGNILCGRFDTSKPFFTIHGSFWSNSTTKLLASTSEADRKSRTRNRCNGEGYESVALIPLRASNHVFGLIQLNDHRPDRFTCERITQLERMAGSIAIALSQRQLQKALLESEQQHRVLFESAGDAILIHNPESRILAVNEVACERFGYTRAELLSMRAGQIESAGESGHILDRKDPLMSQDQNVFEAFHRRKDGSIIPTEVNARRIAWSGHPAIMSICRDITGRKRVEEALKKSKSLLAETEKLGKVGGWEFDIETRKLVWTEGVYRIHEVDLSFEPTVEKGIQFYTPCSRPVIEEAVNLSVQCGRPFDVELEIITARGSLRHVHVIGTTDIVQRRVYGFFQDITEQKSLEAEKEKLEAQNRQLQKSESLGRMAGAIAHHFNNQLQVVMMNLDFAMRGKSSDDFPMENLCDAMQSARQAADISTLMLTYLGQTQGKQQPLNFSDIACQSLPMIRASIPKGMVLDTDFPSPGPVIHGNADQIQQVLINLVTNAREASLDGRGVIRIALKVVSKLDIPMVNRFPIDCKMERNSYACLEVADEGCGILADNIEKLFDPFYSSKFTGRGLGLPVVLGVVRVHNGAITVESEPGRGSIFRVFLPVSFEPHS